MPGLSRSQRDAERRISVEREHQLKDLAEDYERAKAAATSTEERAALTERFAAARTAHRQEDIARGKRLPGTAVMMHQILWVRWLEVTVEHELAARDAYHRIVNGHIESLLDEFRDSLVTITAAAVTIEALYEDTRFLIPAQPKVDHTWVRVANAISIAFGLDANDSTRLSADLEWLFDRRNEAAHPYSELELPQPHPAGIGHTGIEHSRFNAIECEKASDIVLWVLKFAETPPNPNGRWVARWVKERAPYQEVVQQVRSRRVRRCWRTRSRAAGATQTKYQIT